ncbi:MAG: GNAT family N-acetyltransferase [Pseudomonadota bacterium]
MNDTPNTRLARADDEAAAHAAAAASGLLSDDELAGFAEMIADHFAALAAAPDGRGPEEAFWLILDADDLSGAAYVAAEPFGADVWNLLFIGLPEGARGRGGGGALLRHAEEAAAARSARMLLIETSGVPDFAPVRRLYRHCGYGEEARIRGYYGPGEDKVVFRKALGDEPNAA